MLVPPLLQPRRSKRQRAASSISADVGYGRALCSNKAGEAIAAHPGQLWPWRRSLRDSRTERAAEAADTVIGARQFVLGTSALAGVATYSARQGVDIPSVPLPSFMPSGRFSGECKQADGRSGPFEAVDSMSGA